MTQSPAISLECQRVEAIFAQCFAESERTRLVGGFDEPEYVSWQRCAREYGPSALAEIRYRADFVASAFHEVAHWCIAGRARRQQDDFGYWYADDGRSAKQQHIFCGVEVRPQAVESFFHAAWGSTFHASFDNLDGETIDEQPFRDAIATEQASIREKGLPPRAARFAEALKYWERRLQLAKMQ
jgi:elongation factor P hydroxylase